ncbi:hypothetical protein [Agrobacterium rosae]
MNTSDARASITDNGYIGQYRLCWRSDYFTVQHRCDKSGELVPTYFKNPVHAELYAWREKHRQEQSVMTRDGDKIGTKSAAEMLFAKPGRVLA